MLPTFFALVKPASTIANPHCIKNTNAAPIRYHTLISIISLLVLRYKKGDNSGETTPFIIPFDNRFFLIQFFHNKKLILF